MATKKRTNNSSNKKKLPILNNVTNDDNLNVELKNDSISAVINDKSLNKIVSETNETLSDKISENTEKIIESEKTILSENTKDALNPILDFFDKYKLESLDVFQSLRSILSDLLIVFKENTDNFSKFFDSYELKKKEDEADEIENAREESLSDSPKKRKKKKEEQEEEEESQSAFSKIFAGVFSGSLLSGILGKGLRNPIAMITGAFAAGFSMLSSKIPLLITGIVTTKIVNDAREANEKKRLETGEDSGSSEITKFIGDALGGKDNDTWSDSFMRYGAAGAAGFMVGGLPGAAIGVGAAGATDLVGAQNITDGLGAVGEGFRTIGQYFNLVDIDNDELEKNVATAKKDLEINLKKRAELERELETVILEHNKAKKSGDEKLIKMLDRKRVSLGIDIDRIDMNNILENSKLNSYKLQKESNLIEFGNSIPMDTGINAAVQSKGFKDIQDFQNAIEPDHWKPKKETIKEIRENKLIELGNSIPMDPSISANIGIKKLNDAKNFQKDFHDAIEPNYWKKPEIPIDTGIMNQVVKEKSGSMFDSIAGVFNKIDVVITKFDDKISNWLNGEDRFFPGKEKDDIIAPQKSQELFNDPMIMPNIFTEAVKKKTIDIQKMAQEKNARETNAIGAMLSGMTSVINNQNTQVSNTSVSNKNFISRPVTTYNKSYTGYGRGE